MNRNFLFALLCFAPIYTFGQVGSHQLPLFNDESVKSNMAARAAADARREREAAALIERQKRQQQQAESDYAEEKVRELETVRNLPTGGPETQRQLDLFNCMYPPFAVLPPSATEVDGCLRKISSEREKVKQEAIAEQERLKAEQERLGAENARAERARLEAERLKAEEAAWRVAEEKAAAKEKREAIIVVAVSLIGLMSLLIAAYWKRTYLWPRILSLLEWKGAAKWNRAIIFPAVLLILGWLYATPYLVLSAMKSAADNKDAAALSEYVDFAAVRDSLKASIKAKVVSEVAKDSNSNPFAVFGAALAGSFVDAMADAVVTPQGLANLMKGEKAPALRDIADSSKNTSRQKKSDSGTQVTTHYVSWNRFEVEVAQKTDPTQKVKLVLLRQGLVSWKLSSIELLL